MEEVHSVGPWRVGVVSNVILSRRGDMVVDLVGVRAGDKALISAAPELLKVVFDLLDDHKKDAHHSDMCELCIAAKAAIRKAVEGV